MLRLLRQISERSGGDGSWRACPDAEVTDAIALYLYIYSEWCAAGCHGDQYARHSYLRQYNVAFLLSALFPYLVSLSVYAGEVGEYCFFPYIYIYIYT